MYGGEISGNLVGGTRGSGGGVSGSSIRIITGTIYGNSEAVPTLRNTSSASGTAALYGTAQHGTFTGATWNSSGNLTTTNNTIKVVNGVLQ
jgi:hypothetical protein